MTSVESVRQSELRKWEFIAIGLQGILQKFFSSANLLGNQIQTLHYSETNFRGKITSQINCQNRAAVLHAAFTFGCLSTIFNFTMLN